MNESDCLHQGTHHSEQKRGKYRFDRYSTDAPVIFCPQNRSTSWSSVMQYSNRSHATSPVNGERTILDENDDPHSPNDADMP